MPTRAERERHGNSNTDYDILAYRYTVTELVRVSDMAGMVGGEWEESGSRVGSEWQYCGIRESEWTSGNRRSWGLQRHRHKDRVEIEMFKTCRYIQLCRGRI